MNAQLNSTNFQQFTTENKGKIITFKHNNEPITRLVFDVCGEYFTGKINASDAKIDGFYYFSDCKMIETKHPLQDIFEKHKFTVVLTTGYDFMAEYVDYCTDGFVMKDIKNGQHVRLVQPYFYIKEVWAIVDGKLEKVWSTEGSLNNEKEPLYSDLNHILSTLKNCTIKTRINIYKNFKFQNISESGVICGLSEGTQVCLLAKDIIEIIEKGETLYYKSLNLKNVKEPSNKHKEMKKILLENKNCTIKTPKNSWVNFNFISFSAGMVTGYKDNNITMIFETDIDSIISKDGITLYLKRYIEPSIDDEENQVGFFKPYHLSPFLREFLGLKENIKYVRNDITKKVIDYCKQHVNPQDKTKIIPDGKIYNLIGGEFGKQITFFELQKILDKHFLKESSKSMDKTESFEEFKEYNIDQEEYIIKKEKFNLIKEHYSKFLSVATQLKEYTPNTNRAFIKALNTINTNEFSIQLVSDFTSSWDNTKDEMVAIMKTDFKKDPIFQALVRRFVELVLLITVKNNQLTIKLRDGIIRSMSKEGLKEYESRFE